MFHYEIITAFDVDKVQCAEGDRLLSEEYLKAESSESAIAMVQSFYSESTLVTFPFFLFLFFWNNL